MKFRRHPGGAHVKDYERLSDGKLRVGTPCFSGPRLKKRFTSPEEADNWVLENPKRKVTPYECFMCGGWHLTTEKK